MKRIESPAIGWSKVCDVMISGQRRIMNTRDTGERIRSCHYQFPTVFMLWALYLVVNTYLCTNQDKQTPTMSMCMAMWKPTVLLLRDTIVAANSSCRTSGLIFHTESGCVIPSSTNTMNGASVKVCPLLLNNHLYTIVWTRMQSSVSNDAINHELLKLLPQSLRGHVNGSVRSYHLIRSCLMDIDHVLRIHQHWMNHQFLRIGTINMDHCPVFLNHNVSGLN